MKHQDRTIQPVITTNGDEFTPEDTIALARLIHKRFGKNIEVTSIAWRRLFQNTCPDAIIAEMLTGINQEN